MARFRRGLLSARDATGEIHLSRSRFYVLYADFLRACAQRRQRSWEPGSSGGNHHPAWSAEVCALLRKLLRARPPASYSFAVSEVHRRYQLRLDRASVRRWALTQGLAPDTRHKAPRQPVRRWQVQQIGQLWQYDASPTAGLARSAFTSSGLPLALYVDYHSFFFTQQPDAFTQLGAALRFYEVSLRYAPTPQAKGKIERLHDFWQKRLPAVFAADGITALAPANALLEDLRVHRNAEEKHREIGSTPQAAWKLALREKRSALRPVPSCPWWPYVWSQRSSTRVDPDGRIAIGTAHLRIAKPPGSKVVRCLHPNGDQSVLAAHPDKNSVPVLLLHSPAPSSVLL